MTTVFCGQVGEPVTPGIVFGVSDDIFVCQRYGDDRITLIVIAYTGQAAGPGTGFVIVGSLLRLCYNYVVPGFSFVCRPLQFDSNLCRPKVILIVTIHPVLAHIVGAVKFIGQRRH